MIFDQFVHGPNKIQHFNSFSFFLGGPTGPHLPSSESCTCVIYRIWRHCECLPLPRCQPDSGHMTSGCQLDGIEVEHTGVCRKTKHPFEYFGSYVLVLCISRTKIGPNWPKALPEPSTNLKWIYQHRVNCEYEQPNGYINCDNPRMNPAWSWTESDVLPSDSVFLTATI